MTQQIASPEQIEQEISATRAEIDETLIALQNKLSFGQFFDQALGYAREGGGEFAANFARTVRDNPLPVAILGIGVGWLMMSGRTPPKEHLRADAGPSHRHSSEPDRRRPTPYEPAGSDPSGSHSVAEARPAGGGYAGESGSKEQSLKDKVSDVASRRKQRAAAGESRIGDKASEIAGSARENVGKAGERLSEMRDDLSDRVVSTRDRAGQYASHTHERLSRARDSADRYIHENPLVIGAAAFAAGAALGALLPATRREREWMGEHSESVKVAAQDTIAEGAQKVKTVAQTALERGKEEAQRQGLKSESDKRTAGASQAGSMAGRSSGNAPDKPAAAGRR